MFYNRRYALIFYYNISAYKIWTIFKDHNIILYSYM